MLYCCSYCKCDIETSLGDEIYECNDKVCKALNNVFCSEECRDEHILKQCNVVPLSLIQRFKLYLLKKIMEW